MIDCANLSAAPTRRGFLKGVGGVAFVLGFGFPARANAAGFSPSVFITLDETGQVAFTIGRPEMGQGVRSSLAMIMADEMSAAWPRVSVRQADADARFGDQDTDASRSIRIVFKPLRIAGATARYMLEMAAAQAWRASPADCRAVDHEVIHVPTGRAMTFAQLVKGASTLAPPPPDRVRLKDPSSRRYIGHTMAGLDGAAMVHGRVAFGADIGQAGLKYASIARCPVYGGRVRSFDPANALAVRGVERILEIPASPLPTGHLPLGGVAVIASNGWAAIEGRRKLKIVWDPGPNATHDSAAYRSELEAAARKPGRVLRSQGGVDIALGNAATRLTADYFMPYQAHATMEPPAAVAAFDGARLAVSAPTQNPQGLRTTLAQYLAMREADIAVHPTFLGNGYGRKAMHDFVCEAAWLAKAAGAPVKLAWTREDDIGNGYYQPMCAQRIEGGLDKNGVPIVWRHRSVFPAPSATFHAEQTQPDTASVSQGLVDMPYAIPNLRCEVATAPGHLRFGSYHGGMSIPHAFAVCSFMDELAAAAQKDAPGFLFTALAGPRKLDLKALGVDYANYGAPPDEYPIDIGRLQNVLELVVDRCGWSDPLLPRQGRGLAVHRSVSSYVAGVALVAVGADGQLSIPRFDIAIDCGQVVNPDRVRALMEEAVMFGIGLALNPGLSVKGGAIQELNFDAYTFARATDAPEIRVHVAVSAQPPGGVADAGAPVVPPAICNAVFAATGKRIRSLPIDSASLKDDGESGRDPPGDPGAQPPG